MPAKNIYSNFISTLSRPESAPPTSHLPIRAITTKFGPVSFEKEVSHAETPDLLQIHNKSQTSRARKEYLFQLYLHLITARICSSGITPPNSRYYDRTGALQFAGHGIAEEPQIWPAQTLFAASVSRLRNLSAVAFIICETHILM